MILCYEGTPGSGKSYDAVRKILDNLKLGRIVYTNIDGMDSDKSREFIKLHTGLDDYDLGKRLIMLSKDDVYRFWEIVKNGALIVIDEAHKWFNCRDWQKVENRKFGDWCSTHRHYGFDVLLITQNIEKLDSAVRGLVEWTYRYKKINFFGSLVGNSYICYAYQEDASGKPLKRITKQYDKAIFKCYESYVSQDVKEMGVQKNTNILFHPVFYAIPVLLLVFGYFFMRSGFSHGEIIPGSAKAKELTSKKVSSQPESKGVSVSPPSPGSSPSTESAELPQAVKYSQLKQAESYLIIGLVGASDDENEGWVLYQPFGVSNIRLRASRLEFDRFCKCNSFARYRAGDLVAF